MSAGQDYNPPGEWSVDAVLERYRRHARALGTQPLLDLTPRTHTDRSGTWVYPVLECVIDGIRAGDLACVELGVEFVESSGRQPFGRILHANVARALRRAVLTETQIDRLRRRILGMLVEGEVPHEYHEYAKLLRKIGLGPGWREALARADRQNRYVMRYIGYYQRHAAESAPRGRTRG